eukprot:scaffold61871_cov65-Phaeocystis_antarctica.AAC.12
MLGCANPARCIGGESGAKEAWHGAQLGVQPLRARHQPHHRPHLRETHVDSAIDCGGAVQLALGERRR